MLPHGSDVFRAVLSEIDNKYLQENKYLQTVCVKQGNTDIQTEVYKPTALNTLNDNNVSRENEHVRSNRVQWIDECKRVPIASESKRCSQGDSKKYLKPILKYRPVYDWF